MSNNIEVHAAVHGIAPRSDELLRLGGDLERGRITQAAYDEHVLAETQDWLDVQQAAGIDWPETGKLDWQDHLRPIVEATEGFAPDVDNAPVTRWPRTNTFYREPTITGELTLDTDAFGNFLNLEPDRNYLSLLAPYTFARSCNNETDIDSEKAVFHLYEQILQYARDASIGRITLSEYAPADSEETFWFPHVTWVEELAERFPDINLGYLQLGEAAKARIVPLDASPNFGVVGSPEAFNNLAASKRVPFLNESKHGTPREYWLPVISGDSTKVDEVSFGPELARNLETLSVERVVLTHTTDLQLLPLPYAQEKIKHLGEAAQQLREQLGA